MVQTAQLRLISLALCSVFLNIVVGWTSLPVYASGTIAFLGDDLVTGTAAHPLVRFNRKFMWTVLEREQKLEVDPEVLKRAEITFDQMPQRLGPTTREVLSPWDWVGQQFFWRIGAEFYDFTPYATSYWVGRKLGYPGEKILIAGDIRARVNQLSGQMDRVLDASRGQDFPEKLFVMFGFQDLCGTTMESVTSPAGYGAALNDGLSYMLRNLERTPASGIDVYVVAPPGWMQIPQSPDILAKTVDRDGKVVACSAVQQGTGLDPKTQNVDLSVEAQFYFQFFPDSSARLCPTMFGGNIDKTKDQSANLANRVRGFREQGIAQVQELSQKVSRTPHKGSVRFHYVSPPAELVFRPDDIAADCMHLSAEGHKNLGQRILSGL